jgi:rare lipoprotein A
MTVNLVRAHGLSPRLYRAALTIVVSLALSACGTPAGVGKGLPGDGPGNARLAHIGLNEPVRNLPKSRIGNTAGYTVFGQRYAILDSAEGFSETGVASWYGSKFHGRDTSSGEPYDMHAMTAAHKHLPLPTFVRVTRTDTGQSLVVKVNDRGPFVDDRIIDLSYGAALRLDMLDGGTAPVHIEAISTHHVSPDDAQLAATGDAGAVQGGDSSVSDTASPQAHWIQIGAFSDDGIATAELRRVASQLQVPGRVEHDSRGELYRVRLGPLDADIIDSTVAALASAGVQSYTMVTAARSTTVR